MDKRFKSPMDVSDINTPFPMNIDHLMPAYNDIPEEFSMYNGLSSPFLKLQQKWFFHGIKKSEFPPVKSGIDLEKAIMHLNVIQRSWEPKHEHKCAAVAYLMSLWFETPK